MNSLPVELQELILDCVLQKCRRCARDLALTCKTWYSLIPLHLCLHLNAGDRFIVKNDPSQWPQFVLDYPSQCYRGYNGNMMLISSKRRISLARKSGACREILALLGVQPSTSFSEGLSAAMSVGYNFPAALDKALTEKPNSFIPITISSYKGKKEIVRVLLKHNRLCDVTEFDGFVDMNTMRVMIEEGGMLPNSTIALIVSECSYNGAQLNYVDYIQHGPSVLNKIHKKGIVVHRLTKKTWKVVHLPKSDESSCDGQC